MFFCTYLNKQIQMRFKTTRGSFLDQEGLRSLVSVPTLTPERHQLNAVLHMSLGHASPLRPPSATRGARCSVNNIGVSRAWSTRSNETKWRSDCARNATAEAPPLIGRHPLLTPFCGPSDAGHLSHHWNLQRQRILGLDCVTTHLQSAADENQGSAA